MKLTPLINQRKNPSHRPLPARNRNVRRSNQPLLVSFSLDVAAASVPPKADSDTEDTVVFSDEEEKAKRRGSSSGPAPESFNDVEMEDEEQEGAEKEGGR